jgi:hypothetical protein
LRLEQLREHGEFLWIDAARGAGAGRAGASKAPRNPWRARSILVQRKKLMATDLGERLAACP